MEEKQGDKSMQVSQMSDDSFGLPPSRILMSLTELMMTTLVLLLLLGVVSSCLPVVHWRGGRRRVTALKPICHLITGHGARQSDSDCDSDSDSDCDSDSDFNLCLKRLHQPS